MLRCWMWLGVVNGKLEKGEESAAYQSTRLLCISEEEKWG